MRRTAPVALIAVLAACGDGPASSGQPDATPGAPDGGDQSEAIGELVVLSGGGYGHLWFPPVVFGFVHGGNPPAWHGEIASDGACRVLAYRPGFCTDCDGVCLEPDECRPWPDYLSAGAITVGGLAGDPVLLEPELDQHYQTWGGLPDPLFAPGAEVTLEAEGDQVPAFQASATAPARLTVPALDQAGEAVLLDGADIELTWPAPVAGARVRLLAHSGGALHGTPPEVMLECDGEDTGSLVISRAILDQLPTIEPGCAKMHDCAKLGIMRYTRALAASDLGTVSFVVASGIDYPLTSE